MAKNYWLRTYFMYPLPIQNLIKTFGKLPSVGQRTAERYVFHLLKSGKKDVGELALALKNLSDTVKSCQICWDFSDKNPCNICSDKKRIRNTVCVVSDSQNIQIIEKMNKYNGLYHVLRGVIKTDNPEKIKDLKINELLRKIKGLEIKEVILAFSPDLNGETTMMFLKNKIKEANPNLKITRLARGLPTGSDLQYADKITLGDALKNRTENN